MIRPGTPRRAEALRWLLALLAVGLPLVLGQQTPASVTQDFGRSRELPNVTGLQAPEQGEDGPFRWGGDRVTIDLQPLGYPLITRLHVQGVRPADQPAAQLGASAGGQDLGVRELPRSPSDVEIRLPAAALFRINPRLELTSTVFQPSGDRRLLGTVFYRIETINGPGPALPAPWPAAALLLSGLLVYIAVCAATGWTRLALATTIAWGLALGGLNAVVRPWLVFYAWYFVVPPLVVWLLTPWVRGMIARRRHPAPTPPPVAPPTITTRPALLAGVVVAAALLILAWHLVAPLIPSGSDFTDNTTWGVAFYGALPWPLQALGVVFVVGALGAAWVGVGVGGWGLGVGNEQRAASREPDAAPSTHHASHITQSAIRHRQSAIPCVVVAGALLVFSLFPVQYSEGDSSEFDQKIPKGAIWRERELLDFYLKARLWRLLEAWLPRPSQLYALVATLAGGVYVAGALLLGRALGRTRREGWVLAAALCAIGNILLFFGYVESYALVQVASLFVLWACWQYAQGRLSFGAVGALATLAPLFHGSALWWGPAVLAAWLVRAARLPRATRWAVALREGAEGVAAGAAMILVLFSVMVIDGYDLERFHTGLAEMGGADGRTMMPLFTTASPYEHYPYFSWAHLGAIVQEQLLTAPLALITIGLVLALAWPGVRRLAGALPGLIALGVAGAAMFFYSTAWNPDLGPRSDWDLLSLSALPLTLLAVYLLLRLPPGRARRLALTAYLSVSAVHTAAWVAIHVLGIRV
jgi:hypothetical protein